VLPADMPKSTREWLDKLHPDDRAAFRNKSIAAGASGTRVDVEYRLLCADGAWIDVRQAIEPIPGTADADGKMRWFCTLQDVTEQKRVETKVRRLNRVYAVLSGINSLIVRVRDRAELFREACRIAVDAGALKMAWIGVIDPQTLDGKVVATYGEADSHALHIRLTARDGLPDSDRPASRAVRSRLPVICNDIGTDSSVGPMRDELLARGHRSFACLPLLLGGNAVAVLGLLAGETGAFDDDEARLLLELAGDIAFALDHIEKEEKLNYLAYYDSLTGLANSTLLHERLEQYIGAASAQQKKLALVLIDLERFKTINDTFGRHMGDALLRQLAERLAGCVTDRKQLARVGADHFAVVVPGVPSEADLARMVDDSYRQCFQTPFPIANTDLRISAKVGIALYPNDGAAAETLYRNAEAALKKAKAGSEGVLFYSPRMTEAVAQKLALENKLRQALENEEFLLFYQPKVDTNTRRIEGVEALIRWSNPELGLVPPSQFIPLMEETGLILEVGAWALRRAVRDHKRWLDEGLNAPRIAVNVSAVQLRKHDFVATVLDALRLGAATPGIDIEITESLIMEDIQGTIEKLHALRALGIDISIDDFGTGYSSLAYLAKLPVQVLKIDRAFISTRLASADNMTLVSMMIGLAHALRLKVVAEGVEAEEEARMLNLLRCDQMQGYLVGKPVPFGDMSALIRNATKRNTVWADLS
jgi:diguanylate cyclase (GGDEF)-like protein